MHIALRLINNLTVIKKSNSKLYKSLEDQICAIQFLEVSSAPKAITVVKRLPFSPVTADPSRGKSKASTIMQIPQSLPSEKVAPNPSHWVPMPDMAGRFKN